MVGTICHYRKSGLSILSTLLRTSFGSFACVFPECGMQNCCCCAASRLLTRVRLFVRSTVQGAASSSFDK